MAVEGEARWRKAMILGTGSALLGLALSIVSWEESLGSGVRLALSITGLGAAVAGMWLIFRALAEHVASRIKKG